MGHPASKFCSPQCKKRGLTKEQFVSQTILIKSETLHKQEEAKRPVLSLKIPDDKRPTVYSKPNSNDMIQRVKMLLGSSVTLEQVISNILTKHKYKDPKNCVSHIEDMLMLYDPES